MNLIIILQMYTTIQIICFQINFQIINRHLHNCSAFYMWHQIVFLPSILFHQEDTYT